MPQPPADREILYGLEPGLSMGEFIDALQRSGLGERRPIHGRDVMAEMLHQANLILTVRCGGELL